MSNPILVTVRPTRRTASAEFTITSSSRASTRHLGKKPETASMTTTIRQIPNRICACWSHGQPKHQKIYGTTAHYQKLSALKAEYVTNADIQIYDLAAQ